MEPHQNTPGPERPATRRIVAWMLILALVAVPFSYFVGAAGTSGSGSVMLAVLLIVFLLVGGVAFWLHRRTRG